MTEASSYTLVIGGDASVKTAADVASALRQALDTYAAIAVDTQTITSADVTTVQALLAARVKADAEGKAMVMLNPIGEPLRRVLDTAGMLKVAATAAFWSGESQQTIGGQTA